MLSNRIKDEKSDSSVDETLEVEEEQLKSSFRCEVAALRCTSNDFSKLIMSGEDVEVENFAP